MDSPPVSGGDIARAAVKAIVILIRRLDITPRWLFDLLLKIIRAFKRIVKRSGRLFAASYTAAIVFSGGDRPPSTAAHRRPARHPARRCGAKFVRTPAPVAATATNESVLAAHVVELIATIPGLPPQAVDSVAAAVANESALAAHVVKSIAPGSPPQTVDPVAAALSNQPAAAAVAVPKYIVFINTGELQQTLELSDLDYSFIMTEGMSSPGHVVTSVHVAGPDLANVVYDRMEEVEAAVKAFAGGPPAYGPLAGVEMRVSAPAPGPYPTPAPPSGPKYILYAHTNGLQQTHELSLPDYMQLLAEGMSLPGHAVKFVRVRVPDLAHVMYETMADAQAVADAFAYGAPVGGPLDGVEMRVEMKKTFRGCRGRRGRRGEQTAAAA